MTETAKPQSAGAASRSAARHTVRVDLAARSYDIHIGHDLIAEAGQLIAPMTRQPRVFVLTDENVAALHLPAFRQAMAKAGIDVRARAVPAGEASKSWEALGDLIGWLLLGGAGRDDVLVALGGGVVGDLGGLAAGLMKRGMGFVQVPTTLLAQVDSSVGGKTAVNTREGKNLVGLFYQPRLVIADIGLLSTLPEREWRAGFAEVIKYALIDSPAFFDWLEAAPVRPQDWSDARKAEAVAIACRSKARIVAADENEGGVRALLNLGHTFGHALELANGFGPALLHGEAVACGMMMAMRYSARLGLCPAAEVDRAEALIAGAGLVTRVGALPGGPYRAPALLDAMKQDKKVRAGRLPLILVRGIGKSFIRPENDVDDILSFLETEMTLPAHSQS